VDDAVEGCAPVDSSGDPVGLLGRDGVLFLAWTLLVARGNESGFLNAFDLGYAAVMDGNLYGAEAEIGDVLADDFKPVGLGTIR
jgi:hypothetical protein